MLFTPNNINDDIKGILSWNDRGAPPLRLRAYQPAHPVKLARWRVYAMRTDSTDNTSPLNATCVVCTQIAAHTQHGPQRLWLQRAGTQQAAALRDTLASVSATRGCVCEATVACLRVR